MTPLAVVAAAAMLAVPNSVASDGGRVAAWVTDEGRLGVVDASLAMKEFPWPCDAPAPGRRIGAVGDGQVVVNCGRRFGEVDAVAVDAATGGVTVLPGLHEPGSFPDQALVDGIGRHWLRVRISGYHYDVHTYVRRRDGATRRDPDRRNLRPDLDARTLFRSLCAPVLRPPNPDDNVYVSADRFLEVDSSLGWTLRTRRGVPTLQRCGTRRTIAIRGHDVALAGGVVTWRRLETAHALVLRTGEHRRFHLAGLRRVARLGDHLLLARGWDAKWRLTTVRYRG
jgi:hypothetical protein